MSKSLPALTAKQVIAAFPKRPRDSHKGMFGTVAVIGGAAGMVGAPLLAARAALKMGAGCVHVGLLAENAPLVDMVQPELMLHSTQDALQLCEDLNRETKKVVIPAGKPPILTFPLSGGRDDRLLSRKRERIEVRAAGIQSNKSTGFPLSRERQNLVLAIGCGMGHNLAAQKLLYHALKQDVALVLDADALTLLANHADLQDDLRKRIAPSIITPHPGEAARLLACTAKEIQADRAGAAQRLAKQLRCSVVLKGARSVCVTSIGKTYLNESGNPGMSSPGMGDVLTGMIAAFNAQGMSADDAMLLAVHLHGAAGDALAQQGITIGMTATDVTEWARWLLNKWIS